MPRHTVLAGKFVMEEGIEVKFFKTTAFETPYCYEVQYKWEVKPTDARIVQLQEFAHKILDLYIEVYNKPV